MSSAQRIAWEQWHRGVSGASDLDNDHSNSTSANAWARLQFVCGALDMSERLSGRVPIDLSQALGWAHLRGAESAAASSGPMASSEDSSVGLSGERCYELLARALLNSSSSGGGGGGPA